MRRKMLDIDTSKLSELNVGVLEISFSTFTKLVRAQILAVDSLIRYAPSGLLAAGVTGPVRVTEIELALAGLSLSLSQTNRNVRLEEVFERKNWYTYRDDLKSFTKICNLKTVGDLVDYDFRKLPDKKWIDQKQILSSAGSLFEDYSSPQDAPELRIYQSPLLLDFDKSLKSRIVASGLTTIAHVMNAADEKLLAVAGMGPLKVQKLRENIAKKIR
ncbi:MAG: hypothetical protein NVSMB39_1500 [Candidatus Saccharimonadales bacterium]